MSFALQAASWLHSPRGVTMQWPLARSAAKRSIQADARGKLKQRLLLKPYGGRGFKGLCGSVPGMRTSALELTAPVPPAESLHQRVPGAMS